jgi:hypothetical protein
VETWTLDPETESPYPLKFIVSGNVNGESESQDAKKLVVDP